MLQQIRDRLVGWVLWLVLGPIIVTFAFWGIQSFRDTGGGEAVVATVGGKLGGHIGGQKITQSQVRAAYEQRMRQMQQLMGENFRPEQFDQKHFRGLVLDDMVQEAALRLYGADAGYQTPDSLLLDAIQVIPAFQDNGKFSAEQYRGRLQQNGYSPERFESEMRNSLTIDQMRNGVVETAFVTDADVAAEYRLAAQQRSLSFAQFDAAHYASAVTVDEQQVQARYDERKAQFMTPERIKLAYIELSLDKMRKAADPGVEALKAIYETEKATRFSTAEEREARHILIALGADKVASKKHAEELAAKIKGGGDFAALARAESTDTGSKNQGGSLGWVKHGQMVKKFEETLFSMKKGEVSSPVETEFGWHLIKLDDVRPAATRPFDDKSVQDEVLALYQRKDAEKHFQDDQEKLEQLAFENPASLDAAGKALNLEIKTTDWFGRSAGAGIAATPAVNQAAFSDVVLKNNENSKPVSVATGDVVVFRKAEYEAPRQKAFAEVADQLRTQLKDEAAKAKAGAQAKSMLDALRGGAKLEDAAKKADVELKTVGLIKRDDKQIDRQIVSALFHLPHPDGVAPRFDLITLANGNVAVVALNEIKDGDLSAAPADEAKKLRQSLRDRDAGEEFNSFRSLVRDSIKVKLTKAAADTSEEAAAP